MNSDDRRHALETRLERDLDRRLKRLPMPQAPSSLAPRVMAAIALSQRAPWYSRAWSAWPLGWQVASALSVVSILIGMGWGLPYLVALVGSSAWPSITPPSIVTDLARPLGVAWEISRIVYRTTVEPLLGYLAVIMFAMTAVCVAFGAALDRVALGGASEL